LLIDFSKAFDVVDHGILVSKLSRFNIPPCILQWISCVLTGRTQQVKYATKLSAFQPINMGIVQGSGLGPTLYISCNCTAVFLKNFSFYVELAYNFFGKKFAYFVNLNPTYNQF